MRLFLLLILGIGLAHADYAEEEMPMYNGDHGPLVEKNMAFSHDAAERGWKFYESGDYATAMRRFNQAWLLDSDNAESYWGFGLLMGQRARKEEPEKNLEASIHYLEMALGYAPENGRIMGDLAFSHCLLGEYESEDGKKPQKAAAHFKTSSELFPKAYSIEKYPPTIANWSILLFETGNYSAAKQRADEAVKAGYPVDADYLKELNVHLH